MKNVERVFEKQKEFFLAGSTRTVQFRIRQLKRLKLAIKKHEREIIDAVYQDFGKCEFEVFATELTQIYVEITEMIKNCSVWLKTRKEKVPLQYFPGTACVVKEPYGVVLIIGPFNYPVGLILQPLIGAIAAGNCVMIKPSEYSMNFTKVLEKMLSEIYTKSYVAVCNPESGKEMVNRLLNLHFDYIFFTGSVRTGKIIMEKAAKNLIPVTLELGGKSPCIVDQQADLKMAARKITWGKLINAGQTCIAPDYILVHESKKEEFLAELAKEFKRQYGENPIENKDYCGMINKQAVERVSSYINEGTVYYGGHYDIEKQYIEPTILVDVDPEANVMKDEIFGPVLPVFSYECINDIIKDLQKKEKPLALYVFSRNKAIAWSVINQVSSGGVCINDTIFHAACSKLPFGGVGNSGIGAYHGKYSIDTFTHDKTVYSGGEKIDIPYRYAPYGNKLNWIRKLF